MEPHNGPWAPLSVAHIFDALVIHRQMDGPEGTPSNLLLDHILVDAVDGGTVAVLVRVLGSRMQRLFDLMWNGRLPAVVTEGTFVCGRRATGRRTSAIIVAELGLGTRAVYRWVTLGGRREVGRRLGRFKEVASASFDAAAAASVLLDSSGIGWRGVPFGFEQVKCTRMVEHGLSSCKAWGICGVVRRVSAWKQRPPNSTIKQNNSSIA